MLSYRLFQIAKRFTSGELLLLRTFHDSLKCGATGQALGLSDWARKIAKLQDHNLSALVLKNERALVEEELISGYRDATIARANQVITEQNARLTDLGVAFCTNIEVYRIETQPDPE